MNKRRAPKLKIKKSKVRGPVAWSTTQLPKANAPLVNQFHDPKVARTRPICIVTRFNAEGMVIESFKTKGSPVKSSLEEVRRTYIRRLRTNGTVSNRC